MQKPTSVSMVGEIFASDDPVIEISSPVHYFNLVTWLNESTANATSSVGANSEGYREVKFTADLSNVPSAYLVSWQRNVSHLEIDGQNHKISNSTTIRSGIFFVLGRGYQSAGISAGYSYIYGRPPSEDRLIIKNITISNCTFYAREGSLIFVCADYIENVTLLNNTVRALDPTAGTYSAAYIGFGCWNCKNIASANIVTCNTHYVAISMDGSVSLEEDIVFSNRIAICDIITVENPLSSPPAIIFFKINGRLGTSKKAMNVTKYFVHATFKTGSSYSDIACVGDDIFGKSPISEGYIVLEIEANNWVRVRQASGEYAYNRSFEKIYALAFYFAPTESCFIDKTVLENAGCNLNYITTGYYGEHYDVPLCTTEELKSSSFLGWDFSVDGDWRIDPTGEINGGYPYLKNLIIDENQEHEYPPTPKTTQAVRNNVILKMIRNNVILSSKIAVKGDVNL